MTLALADNASGRSLELYGAQELTSGRDGAVDAKPTTGFGSEEGTFITALEQSGEVTVRGAVTGPRLERNSNWPDDPVRALAEWVTQFQEYVNGRPGAGYTLTRDYRNDSYAVVPTDLTWIYRGGEPYEVGFDITLRRGTPAGVSGMISPKGVRGPTTLSVAGRTIDTLREFQANKSQPLSEYRRLLAENPDEGTDLFADTGPTKRLRVVGRVAGSVSERNSFDADLTDSIGQDVTVTVTNPLTGIEIEAAVDSYESTDEAGITRLSEFGLDLVVGRSA